MTFSGLFLMNTRPPPSGKSLLHVTRDIMMFKERVVISLASIKEGRHIFIWLSFKGVPGLCAVGDFSSCAIGSKNGMYARMYHSTILLALFESDPFLPLSFYNLVPLSSCRMISMMDAISAEQQRAQMAKGSNQQDPLTKPKGAFRNIADTPVGPPASSFPKRLWSLQNLAGGGQQWRKVGPLPPAFKTGKETGANASSVKGKSPAFDKQLPFLSVTPSAAEDRPLTDQENELAEIENRDPDHASLNDDDPEHKHGLRRKAAKGLKRIMTHFSLSDVSSLPDHFHSALDDEEKEQVASHSIASSSGTHDHPHLQRSASHQPSSNTLDLTPMLRQTTTTHPTTLRSKIIELLPSHTHDYQRHHYRSQSQPSEPLTTIDLASLADRSLPPLPGSPATTTQSRKPSRHLSNAMEEYLYFKARMNEAHVEQKFRQAVHWLGRPFHRFLSTPLLSTMASQESPITPLMIHRLRDAPALLDSSSRSSSASSLAADATTAAMLLAHRGSPYGSMTMPEEPDPWVQET